MRVAPIRMRAFACASFDKKSFVRLDRLVSSRVAFVSWLEFLPRVL